MTELEDCWPLATVQTCFVVSDTEEAIRFCEENFGRASRAILQRFRPRSGGELH